MLKLACMVDRIMNIPAEIRGQTETAEEECSDEGRELGHEIRDCRHGKIPGL